MASHKLGLFFVCILVDVFLLFTPLVQCDESEDTIFEAMNRYRSSIKLPNLKKNNKAYCLAAEIAWDFDDESPLSIFASGSTITPGNLTQLPNFPDYLSQCEIDLNHTRKGVILPLNMPRLALNLLITDCTNSQMEKYLGKSEYTLIGIGYYEDWVVFVLGTDSPAGSFTSSASLSALKLKHHRRYVFLVSSLLSGLFVFLFFV